MKFVLVSLLLALSGIALWQRGQLRSQHQELARLAETPVAEAPVLEPISSPNTQPHSHSQPQTSATPPPPSWTDLGTQLGAGMKRLMMLRDQLPVANRPPLSEMIERVSTGTMTELDPELRKEIIAEAELIMRSMVGFMASLLPEELLQFQSGGNHPHAAQFGAAVTCSALDLDPNRRSRIETALSSDDSETALAKILTPAQYQTLMEIMRGQRLDELTEAEKEMPFDLLGQLKSFF